MADEQKPKADPKPVAYRINHDGVGAWKKDDLVPAAAVAKAAGDVQRLVDLAAVVPVFE